MAKFKLILIFICIALFSNNVPCFSQENDKYYSQYYFIEGKTHDIQGDYTGALEFYLKALRFENSPGIHYAIAKAYYNLDRLKDALTEINKAISAEPDNISYNILQANLYLMLGNTEKAINVFETTLEKYPEDIQIAYSLARIYEDKKMSSKAVEIYEKITDFYGFDYDVLRRMYEIYFSYKNYSKCLEVIKYLLKLDPYDFSFNMKLGYLYQLNDKYEEALSLYQELYSLNPGNKDIKTELIKLYFLQNDPQKGFELFSGVIGKEVLTYEEKLQVGEIYYNLIETEKPASKIARNIFLEIMKEYPEKWHSFYYLGAIDISENKNTYYSWFDSVVAKADTSVEAYTQVSYSYFNRGNYERAIEVLEKGKTYSEKDFRMNYIYGLCLQRLGKLYECIDYYEKALEQNPNDVSLLSSLASVFNTLQRYDESEAMYERALKIDPENALILNNYAYNLATRGVKLNKALKMSRKSLERDAKNPNFLDTFGWIYYKLEEYIEAEKYIKQSLEINSASAVVQEHLGDVYSAMKNKEKAETHYKKALELNPNNEGLKIKIENLKK